MKVITIIDCFIKNESNQKIVESCIQKMKGLGHPIMLVSGNVVNSDLQSQVDFFFYDSRNQLFEKEDYIYTHPWHFWVNCGGFLSHNFYYSRQRHGLQVLINLFNALRLAKSCGFTHFQKVLYDMDPSQKCLDWINQIPLFCENQKKSGLCYYNDNGGENDDMEGSYLFFEIDYFLNKIPQIGSEEDYRNLVLLHKGRLEFMIVEKFLHFFLEKNGSEDVIKRSQSDFESDFDGILNGSQTSEMNFARCYEGFPIRISKIKNGSGLYVMAHNFSGTPKSRRVKSFFNDRDETVEYDVYLEPNFWSFQNFELNLKKIEVFNENGDLLYEENHDDSIQNYIEFL
jgi:hypothetical protein